MSTPLAGERPRESPYRRLVVRGKICVQRRCRRSQALPVEHAGECRRANHPPVGGKMEKVNFAACIILQLEPFSGSKYQTVRRTNRANRNPWRACAGRTLSTNPVYARHPSSRRQSATAWECATTGRRRPGHAANSAACALKRYPPRSRPISPKARALRRFSFQTRTTVITGDSTISPR